jgi:D-sedoheptulose 7-phosphate isomerase
MLTAIKNYLKDINNTVDKVPVNQLNQVIQVLLAAYENDSFVFVMGNGGSAATASHLACDLNKGTINAATKHKRFKVMALTDNMPMITAWANDVDYENIFAEQLAHFINPGDVVIGISGSGNSPNIINAFKFAATQSAITIGLTGFEGGLVKDVVDHCLTIPSDNMQHIEDMHMIASHLIASVIRDSLLAEKDKAEFEYIDFGRPNLEGVISQLK